MTIDILCKVVDNYGDIGVAYRLARAVSALPDPPGIRLVVDDLAAFASIDPSIDPEAGRQDAHGWEILPWAGEAGGAAPPSYRAAPPRAVVECFACGRPPWLEDLLFSADAPLSLILDLEHLTAERFAIELHRMPSLTRSGRVRKAMFMPGFERGTGGLILDGPFMRARELARDAAGRLELRKGVAASLGRAVDPGAFWVTIFGYERDYGRIVADLAAYAGARPGSEGRPGRLGRGLVAFAAAGKSQACFRSAWEGAGRPFPLVEAPFLRQEAWDELLLACDFSIVRGEDSWARACLGGRPFLWQAYPQESRHQLAKVEAFLGLLRPRLAAAAFEALARASRAFNDRDADGPGERGEEDIRPLLDALPALEEGYRDLADSVAGLGDLAERLVAFLGELTPGLRRTG